MNLNFKNWLVSEESKGTLKGRNWRSQMGSVPNAIKYYQVRDLRTAPYGPFTGFRDVPSLPARVGSDFLHGMSNLYQNVRDQSTLQPVRPTYDLTRDFKIDSENLGVSFVFPAQKNRIFFFTNSEGKYVDLDGKEIPEESRVRRSEKEIKKLANGIAEDMMRDEDIVKALHEKNADPSTLHFVEYSEVPKQNEVLLMKFAAKAFHKDKMKMGLANPNHRWNADVTLRAKQKSNENPDVIP